MSFPYSFLSVHRGIRCVQNDVFIPTCVCKYTHVCTNTVSIHMTLNVYSAVVVNNSRFRVLVLHEGYCPHSHVCVYNIGIIMHTYTYVHMYTSTHRTHAHTIHMYTHTHVHTHVHTCTCTHIHMYTYTHVHICTCTHLVHWYMYMTIIMKNIKGSVFFPSLMTKIMFMLVDSLGRAHWVSRGPPGWFHTNEVLGPVHL